MAQPDSKQISIPLRLAVDAHNLLCDQRGIARYLREILCEWATQDVELTLLVHRVFPKTARAALTKLLPGVTFALSSRVPQTVDLVWHPWNGTFFMSRKPSVVTIHDTTPFDFPEADAKRRASQQEPFRLSARTARKVFTVSAHAARGITQHLGVESERIIVTPLAVGREFVTAAAKPAADLPADLRAKLAGRAYLLCVSSMDPVKNFAALYHAWCQAFPNAEAALVAVGVEPQRFPQAIAVERTGEVGTLIAVYRGARILVVPSHSESFGLPILEAMHLGIPVLATKVGGIPQTGGDAIAYLPHDEQSWPTILRIFFNDEVLHRRLWEHAAEHLARFSWQLTAERTLAACREAAH